MQALQSSFAGVRVAAKPAAQRKAATKAPVVRASAADDVRKAVRAAAPRRRGATPLGGRAARATAGGARAWARPWARGEARVLTA